MLSVPPVPRCETAGGRSTRMIIDSASYVTTPSTSPPNELRHIFSSHDTHHKIPDIEALTEIDQVLRQQLEQRETGSHLNGNLAPAGAEGMPAQKSNKEANTTQGPGRQGIIPPHMLESISKSEAASARSRESAKQTLLSSMPLKVNSVVQEETSLRSTWQ